MIANRLASTHYDVRDFYVPPVRRRVSGLNAYTVLLGGFQFFVLADGRAVPHHLQPLVINGRDALVSLAVPLEETGEFQGIREIADRARRTVRLSPLAFR